MDYDPTTDIGSLEKLWLEQEVVRKKQENHLSRHSERIKANRARGMSRQGLERIYGAQAVILAIGYPAPEKKL